MGLDRVVGSRARQQGDPHRHRSAAQVRGGPSRRPRDSYLIPTAEVMLTNLHANEVLDGSELPIRYCAYTPVLPRGGRQRRTRQRGIIRVHQFDKVEMVRFANPEKSDAELEDMTACAEKILQELGLPIA